MGFAGQQAPNFGVNNMLLFMRGPDDGQIRVALQEDSGIHIDEFRERLRRVLPERIRSRGSPQVLRKEGLSPKEAEARAAEDELWLRAGRHRQRGHELRLADADRNRHRQPQIWLTTASYADKVADRAQVRFRSLRDRANPAVAGLPHGADHHRPPEGRPERRRRPPKSASRCWWRPPRAAWWPAISGRTRTRASATRSRSRCPIQRMDSAAQVRDIPAGGDRSGPQPAGARRGRGGPGRGARRVRSHVHAALPQRHGQCRGRGPRPGCPGKSPMRSSELGHAAAGRSGSRRAARLLR